MKYIAFRDSFRVVFPLPSCSRRCLRYHFVTIFLLVIVSVTDVCYNTRMCVTTHASWFAGVCYVYVTTHVICHPQQVLLSYSFSYPTLNVRNNIYIYIYMYCCQMCTSNLNDHSIQSNPHSYEKLSVQIINMSVDSSSTKYDYHHIISNNKIYNTSTVRTQSQTTKFKESVQYSANPKMSFSWTTQSK